MELTVKPYVIKDLAFITVYAEDYLLPVADNQEGLIKVGVGTFGMGNQYKINPRYIEEEVLADLEERLDAAVKEHEVETRFSEALEETEDDAPILVEFN